MTAARAIADAPSAPVLLRLAPADPDRRHDWRDDALCAEVDTGLFFPDNGGSPAAAKRVCAGCTVRAECLDYALTHSATDGRFGVWGGLDERERRRYARTLQRHRRAS